MPNETDTLVKFVKEQYSSYVGKTIKEIRLMTQKELDEMYWEVGYSDVPIVVIFDDNQAWIPSRDFEGNGPGCLITADVETISFR